MVIRNISLVQKYIFPLTTLRFVTSHRISILHLQSVIIRISLHFLHPLLLQRYVNIVFKYTLKKPFIVFT